MLRQPGRPWFVPLLLAAGAGCSRIDVRELPAYADALRASGPERPRLLFDNQVEWDGLPTMVPYAVLIVQRGAGVPVDRVTRQLWWKAQALKADAVRVVRHGYTLNDPAVLEYGASLTDHWQKVVAPEYGMLGICLRRCPGKVDLRLDESGALQIVSPDLQALGVERWDRLIAVNDIPVDVPRRLHSRHFTEVLKTQPGHDLKLTWERRGVGVRDTVLKLNANTTFPPGLPDSLEWHERPTSGS